jgi:ankyrin repeat protein
MILKHQKIDVNIKDNDGYTPLMIACCNIDNDILKDRIELLLDHPNININEINNNNLTYLDILKINDNINFLL